MLMLLCSMDHLSEVMLAICMQSKVLYQPLLMTRCLWASNASTASCLACLHARTEPTARSLPAVAMGVAGSTLSISPELHPSSASTASCSARSLTSPGQCPVLHSLLNGLPAVAMGVAGSSSSISPELWHPNSASTASCSACLRLPGTGVPSGRALPGRGVAGQLPPCWPCAGQSQQRKAVRAQAASCTACLRLLDTGVSSARALPGCGVAGQLPACWLCMRHRGQQRKQVRAQAASCSARLRLPGTCVPSGRALPGHGVAGQLPPC